MPIFSVFIFCLLCCVVFWGNNKITIKFYNIFIIDCIVKILFLQGYFLKIGSQEISTPGTICDMVLFIFSIIIIVREKRFFYNKVFLLGVLFIAVSLFSIFFELVFPYDGLLLPIQDAQENWDLYVMGQCAMYQYIPSIVDYSISFGKLLLFVVIVIAFKMSFSMELFITSYMKIVKYVKYLIVYGWIEFFLKNIIGNLTFTYDLSAIMFGINEMSLVTEASSRSGIFYSLQGFCKEPSHFNVAIFTIVMLMILGNFISRSVIKRNICISCKKTYNHQFIVLGVILLLFTGGFSGVWLLFVLMLSTLILKLTEANLSMKKIIFRNYKIIIFMFLGSFLLYACVISNDYFGGRIEDVVTVLISLVTNNINYSGLIRDGSSGIVSTLARFTSLYEGFYIFLDRPILGLGYKLQSVHGDTMSYLINMGLLGTLLFYKLLISSTKNFSYNKALLAVLFVLGGLPMIISAYGLCAYWLLFIEGSMILNNSENSID